MKLCSLWRTYELVPWWHRGDTLMTPWHSSLHFYFSHLFHKQLESSSRTSAFILTLCRDVGVFLLDLQTGWGGPWWRLFLRCCPGFVVGGGSLVLAVCWSPPHCFAEGSLSPPSSPPHSPSFSSAFVICIKGCKETAEVRFVSVNIQNEQNFCQCVTVSCSLLSWLLKCHSSVLKAEFPSVVTLCSLCSESLNWKRPGCAASW